MKPLHAELRETRIEKGISLEDIYRETKIRTTFLERIEDGDYSIVPEPFIRAFLREYAEAVGLDPDRVIAKFEGKSLLVRDETPSKADVPPPPAALSGKTKTAQRRSPSRGTAAGAKSAARKEAKPPAPPESPAPVSTGETASPAPEQPSEPPETRISVPAGEMSKPEAELRRTGPLSPEEEPRPSRTFIFGVFIILIIIATLVILFINGKLAF